MPVIISACSLSTTHASPHRMGLADRVRCAGFLVVLSRQVSAVRTPAAMIKAFQTFDEDLKGYVTTAEFRGIMGRIGACDGRGRRRCAFRHYPTLPPPCLRSLSAAQVTTHWRPWWSTR